MKNQKGFALTLIVAILAVLAVGSIVFVTQKKEAKAPVVTEYFPIKELGIEIPLSADIQDLTYKYNSDSKSVSFSSKSLQGKGGDCSTDIGSLGYIFIRNTATTTIVADNEVSAVKTVGDKNIYYFQSQNPCSVDKKVLDYAYSQIIILKSALNNARLIKAVDTPIVGGDRDAHGCLGSVGYSWCAVKNKCLRVWEEKCEVFSTSTKLFITVVSPNGGEVWEIGRTYTISFGMSSGLGMKTVRLNRYSDDGVRVGAETIGITETDTFSFKIPLETETTRGDAARYKIQVLVDKYAEGMGVADESDNYFSIISPSVAECITDNDCMEVSCPGTGGFAHEICTAGKCAFAPGTKERCTATTTGPVACTMDAMMCPDGTYVGRSAPDCKFVCPAIGENSFCGGIAGIKCASGLTCKYDGTYPDAGGKCISEI